MISVSIHGNVLDALDKDYEVRRNKVNTAIQKAGIKCAASAKKRCPVDTGRLRSSIQYQGSNLRVDVTTNVNYSKYIEFGTRYMAARPYMMPAYLETATWLTQALSDL